MTTDLVQKRCRPCEGIEDALSQEKIKGLLTHFVHWQADSSYKKISREFVTKNFMAAIDFINKVAQLAEEEGHHPDIHLTGYRKLRIDLSTHAIGGLSENDFILAAKIEKLPVELKKT